MKYICIGDLHIDENLPYSLPDKNRLEDIRQAWLTMMTEARNHNADSLIIAGDTLNNVSATPVELEFLASLLADARSRFATTIIVSGNHEVDVSGKSILGVLSWAAYVDKARYTGEIYGIVEAKNHIVVLINYRRSNEEFLDVVKIISDKYKTDNRKKILVAHQPVQGARLRNIEASKGLKAEYFRKNGAIGSLFDVCVFGDFHRPQLLPYGRGFYTGSLIQQSFRDEGFNCGCWILDTETEDYTHVPIHTPRFHTILVSEDKKRKGKWVIKEFTPVTNNCYLKIVFTGTMKFVNIIRERIIKHYEKNYSPQKIIIPSPIISDRGIPTRITTRKTMEDEALVGKVVNSANTKIDDDLLYDTGLEIIKQAKKRKR